MTKYDTLDPRKELEQVITKDLQSALEKQKCKVVHNGTPISHATGGKPDIQIYFKNYIINIEPTKTTKSNQDREFQAIRDHLNDVKQENSSKKCYCIFVSPETSQRTIDSIKDYNKQRLDEGKNDMKILPLSFDALELWTKKLAENEKELYPFSSFIELFDLTNKYIDDLRIYKLIIKTIFPDDPELSQTVKDKEIEHDEKVLDKLIKDLSKTESYMRQNGIATAGRAIDNLILLVFLKLFEEKRERDHHLTNRLRSTEKFNDFVNNSVDPDTKDKKRAIHFLFNQIKQDKEFKGTRMFTENDNLADSLDDDFIRDKFISIYKDYNFIGTKIDALGAVYEVLAQRASKDVKVGQFFTPENVVRFIVEMAELDYNDKVLDPACGTGRFLIHSMHDMLHKAEKSKERNKEQIFNNITKKQCFGTDIDQRIAKIAKMNMWINGDGKSNIFGGKYFNGLLLHRQELPNGDSFDGNFDCILTNPPLGELNYQELSFYDEPKNATKEQKQKIIKDKFERIPILPLKNLTEEKAKEIQQRIDKYISEKEQLEIELKQLEKGSKKHKSLSKKIAKKLQTINDNKTKLEDLNHQIKNDNSEFEITGNNLKGGAMFLTSIWHYLKNEAYPDELPEWKGGKLITVLDEGVFNTDNYSKTRDFIKKHFYIKAVISLTKDTFVPISKTATKTSLLYAIKKTDIQAIQKEPVFFAHVDKVGMNTQGKVCANDLDMILRKYFIFKENVRKSYQGLIFNKNNFKGFYNGKRNI